MPLFWFVVAALVLPHAAQATTLKQALSDTTPGSNRWAQFSLTLNGSVDLDGPNGDVSNIRVEAAAALPRELGRSLPSVGLTFSQKKDGSTKSLDLGPVLRLTAPAFLLGRLYPYGKAGFLVQRISGTKESAAVILAIGTTYLMGRLTAPRQNAFELEWSTKLANRSIYRDGTRLEDYDRAVTWGFKRFF